MRCSKKLSRYAKPFIAVLALVAYASCRPAFEDLVGRLAVERLSEVNTTGEDPGPPVYEASSLINWESPHVKPLAMTPDGARLLAVNTPAARLEVIEITDGELKVEDWIPVGLDPVSVRLRSDDEAWVVNHISDSISVVDLDRKLVTRTLHTADEPVDIVFSDRAAFVVCSQANQVLVFDLNDLAAPPRVIDIAGEDPRAAAISPDGRFVYVTVFESGNLTTIIRQQDVSDPAGPYGGQNPPPNTPEGFEPPVATERSAPPGGLIVRKNLATGRWLDESGADWSRFVTWDLLDNDVAVIDTETLEVRYIKHLMNINMQLAVRPDGLLSIVGTDALNHVRFEPNLTSKFVRHQLALVDPNDESKTSVNDLNPHLVPLYETGVETLPLSDRAASVADPRAILWTGDGTAAYVAGLGSNNVAVIDTTGERIAHIPVGQGPTGLVLDESEQHLYVFNRFDATIGVIDTATHTYSQELPLFDPTPSTIKAGRKFLYDAHVTSGLGITACASCHVDGRMDQLAWDLGNPREPVKAFDQTCDVIVDNGLVDSNCADFHPLKGPMVTQTLQGIIGLEPLHWRGDKGALADFNPAFTGLNGNDRMLTDQEMIIFEDFIASLKFPPNPFRAMDNALPTELRGGNAQLGREFYLTVPVDAVPSELEQLEQLSPLAQGVAEHVGPVVSCNRCHQLPTGTNLTITPALAIKVPQLRNMYDKHSFDRTTMENVGSGFGFAHDGALGTLDDFFAIDLFDFTGDGSDGVQNVRDVIAFVLSLSTDTHAGVGAQLTTSGDVVPDPNASATIDRMLALADSGDVGLVVTGTRDGQPAGYAYLRNGWFADRHAGADVAAEDLRVLAAGDTLTWTLVPAGAERRLGIDADENGVPDGDE